jgi:hypothetical protein
MKRFYNKYIIILLALAVAGTISSCKKLLEIPPNPPDRISGAQVFADSSDVMGAIAGIYSNFHLVDYGGLLFYNGAITAFGGLSSDELTPTNFYPYVQPIYKNSLRATDDGLDGNLWMAAYQIIYMTNAILEGMAASHGLSASLKKHLEGEVKVIRAFSYFYLVNFYGGVPLVTSTDFHVTAKLPRSTADETYQLIIKDLEDAVPLLPIDYSSAGKSRPNKYVAEALLARVYLFQKQWQKAADLSNEVMHAGYSLEPDVSNIFYEGSTEAIWHIESIGDYSATNEGGVFIPGDNTAPPITITPSLLDAFETGDLRKDVWTKTVTVTGVDYTFPFKYKNRDNSNLSPVESYMMLRLGEQYLIHAEAMAQLDHPNEALADLHELRFRAGLDDLTYTDKPALLADIQHERQVELCFEWGHRWLDLKRTNTADPVLSNKPNADWQPTDVLYPIPALEIQTNPFLKQNPGY